MKAILGIIISAILSENFILVKFYGICPFMGVSKKIDTAMGMGMAVTFVMALASAACYAINLLLVMLGLEYMQTVAFILVIAALVQLVEIILKKYIPALHASLGVYLPLITTNCAVLGVTVNNISDGLSFGESMLTSLGCGLGFFLAMVLFCGVRSRVAEAKPAKSFEGLPITLISAAIVSLSFFGFAGIIGNLFG